MKFDSILNYQKLDILLFKLEQRVRGSEEYKNYVKFKKLSHEAKEGLTKLNSLAEEVKVNYTENSAFLEKMIKEASDISVIINDVNSSEELNFHLKSLDKIYSEIVKQEGKVRETINLIKEIENKFKGLINDWKNYHKAFKEYNEKFNQLTNECKGEVEDLKAKMADETKRIDPDLLVKYQGLRTARKPHPYIVEYMNNCCMGCGMDIDISLKDKLIHDGNIECPHWNRILFIKL